MDRETRSRGRQRTGPRRFLRPWEPRLAVATIVTATMAGRVGAATALAATVDPSGDRIQATIPPSAAALAIIGLAVLVWVVVAARRFRHRSSGGDDATIVLPTSLPVIADLDLDLIVSGARAQVARVRDGRGSQSDDRSPEDPGTPTARPTDAPVWVRRLDGRIPIMPTHQNVPVDNEPAARPRRANPRPRRGRGES